MENKNQILVPEVGMPVTEVEWCDCHAYYVTRLGKKNSKGELVEAFVKRAHFRCNDWYGGDWSVGPVDETAAEERIGKTRKGFWTNTGTVKGHRFNLGSAHEYENPSF